MVGRPDEDEVDEEGEIVATALCAEICALQSGSSEMNNRVLCMFAVEEDAWLARVASQYQQLHWL